MKPVSPGSFGLRTAVRLAATVVAVLGVSAIARAQETGAPNGPANATTRQIMSPRSSGADAVEVAGFGELGLFWPSAGESVQAILDRDRLQAVGGGLRLASVEGPYIEVSVGRIREAGSRVFIFEGQIFDLGIPTTVTLIPLDFTIGYRIVGRASPPGLARRPDPRLVPYVGGGIGRMWYRESSEFADDLTEGTTSYHAAGGVEIGVTRWVTGLVEVRYRWAQGVLAEGGVSEEFGEDDLGGPTLTFRIAIGR